MLSTPIREGITQSIESVYLFSFLEYDEDRKFPLKSFPMLILYRQ